MGFLARSASARPGAGRSPCAGWSSPRMHLVFCPWTEPPGPSPCCRWRLSRPCSATELCLVAFVSSPVHPAASALACSLWRQFPRVFHGFQVFSLQAWAGLAAEYIVAAFLPPDVAAWAVPYVLFLITQTPGAMICRGISSEGGNAHHVGRAIAAHTPGILVLFSRQAGDDGLLPLIPGI